MKNPFNLSGVMPYTEQEESVPSIRIDCVKWMFGCEIYKEEGECPKDCEEYKRVSIGADAV